MTIARNPAQASAVIAKHDGPVMPGTPLVVAADETAVFARAGQIIRLVEGGSYQVPPEFAGDGVEVLFVRTRPITGVKFGGPLPPMAGSTARAVFGTFSYRVTSPAALIQSLVGFGSGDEALEPHVKKELQNAVIAAIAQHGTDPSAQAAVVATAITEARGLERYGVSIVGIESLMAR
jgi:membrane protease subunit (stomatin/prohibitin family)